MKIQTQYFLLLLIMLMIMAVGTVIPSYLKVREIDLREAQTYLRDRSMQSQEEIRRYITTLKKAGVSDIESYVAGSQADLIEAYNQRAPDLRTNTLIIQDSGQLVLHRADEERMPIIPRLKILLEKGDLLNERISIGDDHWHINSVHLPSWGWRLVTSMSEQEIYRSSSAYLKYLLLVSISVLAIVIGLYFLFTKRLRRRIKQTISYLTRYRGGETTDRLEAMGSDELDIVQGGINRMLDRVEAEISARKQTEIALQTAKSDAEFASQLKSQFLANASHEIRNPINSIIGFAEILSKTNLNKKQKEYNANILHASQNLTSILNDILDFKKIENGVISINLEPFDVEQEIQSTFNLFSIHGLKKGLDMDCRIDAAVPSTLIGDKARCSQIIGNIMHNAIKFTSQGSVLLEVNVQDQTESTCDLIFRITDTGIGIEEQDQARVFEIFSQVSSLQKADYQGVGLGLAIVEKLIKIMAGSISVDSVPGSGSTFEVILPLKKVVALKAAAPRKALAQTKKLSRLNVLVVDDDVLNREYISEILKGEGIRFVSVNDGTAAINFLEENTVDLVLMDIRMPKMRGDEAIRFIRQEMSERVNSVPIIALTANAYETDIEQYLKMGATSYLAKPFNSQELLSKIDEAMSE